MFREKQKILLVAIKMEDKQFDGQVPHGSAYHYREQIITDVKLFHVIDRFDLEHYLKEKNLHGYEIHKLSESSSLSAEFMTAFREAVIKKENLIKGVSDMSRSIVELPPQNILFDAKGEG